MKDVLSALRGGFWILGVAVTACGGREIGAPGDPAGGDNMPTGIDNSGGATTPSGSVPLGPGSSGTGSSGSSGTGAGSSGADTGSSGSAGASASAAAAGSAAASGWGGSGAADGSATPGAGAASGTGGSAGASSGGGPNCHCTRRSAGQDNVDCPPGEGESVMATIGAEGGKVTLVGQQGKSSGVPFSLDFPPTAFAVDTVVRITETTISPPFDFVDFSPVYLVESDRDSSAPVPIVVPYGNGRDIPRTLSIYTARSQNDTPQRVPDSYVNAGFLQGSVRTFGLFFAGYPRTDQSVCP